MATSISLSLSRIEKTLGDFSINVLSAVYKGYPASGLCKAEIDRLLKISERTPHHKRIDSHGVLFEYINEVAAEAATKDLTIPMSKIERVIAETESLEDDLLVTLQVFLENSGRVRDTADYLHIHQNTLRY